MASKLLNAATATGVSVSQRIISPASSGSQLVHRTFQGTGSTTAGTGTTTIAVEVSDDNINFLTLGTITLTLGTTTTTDGFAASSVWEFVRGNVTGITGTGAAVSLWMGI